MNDGKHPNKCKWFNLSILANFMLALIMLSSITKKGEIVAKMASHAIFQYNVLVIDIDNTTLGLI